MERLHRHLRPLVVAVATLALSAGVVLAGGGLAMPDAAGDGLDRAAEAAGKTVPVVNRPEVPAEPEQPAPKPADEPEQEPVEQPEPADEADAPCAILPEGEEHETHGAKVCAAAQAEVPEGYANRGEYVSEVARDNHGAEVRAEKAANGGVPDQAKAAKEKAKAKADAAGAPANPGPPAGTGSRP
jgi:hypothetical protein